MAEGMLPTNTTLTIYDGNNNQVATVTPQQAARFNQMMASAGGQNALVTFGQAVQAGGNILEALQLRELVRDAQDARRDVKDARKKLDDYLGTASTVDPSKLKTLLSGVMDAQADLDASQNDAYGSVIDSLWINAFGASASVLGGMQGGMGGMYDEGEGDGLKLLAAGGVGALLAAAFSGGGRRRSRRGR